MLEFKQVALDFMNHDHAEFVALQEKLLVLLAQQNGAAATADLLKVDALLAELLEHTRHHFAAEERAMQTANFAPYPAHKGEHDRVLQVLEQRVAHWQQGRDVEELKGFMQGALSDWFVTHVNMMDFVTARFIANQTQA